MTSENRHANVAAELARGEQALRAARELLRLGLLNDAVSRAYYAALHHAMAVLLTEGLDPSTHRGVGSLLGQHFILAGRLPPERAKELSRLEQFRGEADYNRFFVLTDAGAAEEVAVSEGFCTAMRAYLASGGWLHG